MADIATLKKNEFWRKKLRKAVLTRDANKDGTLSRADFKLILERYKQLESSTPEHVETLSKMFLKLVDQMGLNNDCDVCSYEEFEERWMEGMSKPNALITERKALNEMFRIIDTDDDRSISYNGWRDHYTANAIPVEYAQASFDAMDTNKDGRVTKEEFIQYHLEYFFSSENKLNSAILFGPL